MTTQRLTAIVTWPDGSTTETPVETIAAVRTPPRSYFDDCNACKVALMLDNPECPACVSRRGVL